MASPVPSRLHAHTPHTTPQNTQAKTLAALQYLATQALRRPGLTLFRSSSRAFMSAASAPPTPPARRFIIDCDPGVDDAIAILMAVSEAARLNEQILAVTTVHGNVPLDLTTKNAAKVLNVLSVQTPHFDARRIPIYRGCASPLICSTHEYFPWHG